MTSFLGGFSSNPAPDLRSADPEFAHEA